MDNKYNLIYKCRMCGDIVKRKCPKELNNVGTCVEIILAGQGESQHIEVLGVSRCKSHNGVTDLIGVELNKEFRDLLVVDYPQRE